MSRTMLRFCKSMLILVLIILLTGCGEKINAVTTNTTEPTLQPTATTKPLPPAATPTTKPPTFSLIPGDVPPPTRILKDADASQRALEKRTVAGDDFFNNLFERPFTSRQMQYDPNVNILSVSIAYDDNFYYFSMTLQGVDAASNNLTGSYGIEFDRSKTGRGDLLVWAHDLNDQWSVQNVKVYTDPDQDVGGKVPTIEESNFQGNGYEQVVTMEGDKVAYARQFLVDQPVVQFAISRMLLNDPKEFLWGGWVDKGVNDPGKFDYNDFFSELVAGSPLKTSSEYPLKAVALLDNTCRLPVGFTPVRDIPGLCLSIPAVESKNCICVQWVTLGDRRICTVYDCK